MNLQIKTRRPDDLPFIESVFFETKAPEFAPLGLPAPALQQLLRMQFQAQCQGYAAQYPNAQDHVVVLDDEPIGRMMVNRTGGEILLMDIAILERYRNRGIGTALVRQLCDESTASGQPLRLSVRFGNPAEHLYQRAGFVRTGGDGVNISMELRPGPAPIESLPVFNTPPEPFGTVEPAYSSRFFRSLLGHSLTFTGSDGVAIDLILESVYPLLPPRPDPAMDIGDSFVANFVGPLTPVLPVNISSFTPAGAEPLLLTLTPLGPVLGRMTYEAIFNRMQRT
ncbi:MAG: GNAT family N-acetyltransferase [Acidobacteriota bacterium]